MADCKKCPMVEECGMVNTNLKSEGVIPPTVTFCPLKFAVESASLKIAQQPLQQERWTQ